MQVYKSGTELTHEMKSTRLLPNMAALWALGQEGHNVELSYESIKRLQAAFLFTI